MTYTKTIDPHFETIGKHRRLTGYIGTLRDGDTVIHSQEYSTNSQAEHALNALSYELLSDHFEHGLVDTLELDPPGDNPLGDDEGDNTPLLADIAAVLDAALCNQRAIDIVPELRRVRARIAQTMAVVCAQPDDLCSPHDPCEMHAADAAVYLAQHHIGSWQPAVIDDLPY